MRCRRCGHEHPDKDLPRWSPRGRRLVTVSCCYDRSKPVPMLRLRGKWLRALGFEKERRVEIEEAPGRLILRLVKDAPAG